MVLPFFQICTARGQKAASLFLLGSLLFRQAIALVRHVHFGARGLLPRRVYAIVLFTICVSGCGLNNKRVEYVISGSTMGTSYSVKVIGFSRTLPSEEEVKAQIDKRLAGLNQSMSTYIDDSELMKINRAPKETWIKLSDDMFEVMTIARAVSLESVGSFDVTIAPLVNQWGFGPNNRPDQTPGDEQIYALMDKIGYGNYVLRANDRSLTKFKDIQFDLSAIAKGYAVDMIAELLLDLGSRNFMAEIGGELSLQGVNFDGKPWRIGIETPREGAREVTAAISLTNVAMATSGDYRNYYELDGKRLSHTINPLTGKPIEHALASVTVIAKTAAQADAMATAINVLGPDKGFGFAKFKNMAAYFIIRSGEGFETKYTKNFEQYLTTSPSSKKTMN